MQANKPKEKVADVVPTKEVDRTPPVVQQPESWSPQELAGPPSPEASTALPQIAENTRETAVAVQQVADKQASPATPETGTSIAPASEIPGEGPVSASDMTQALQETQQGTLELKTPLDSIDQKVGELVNIEANIQPAPTAQAGAVPAPALPAVPPVPNQGTANVDPQRSVVAAVDRGTVATQELASQQESGTFDLIDALRNGFVSAVDAVGGLGNLLFSALSQIPGAGPILSAAQPFMPAISNLLGRLFGGLFGSGGAAAVSAGIASSFPDGISGPGGIFQRGGIIRAATGLVLESAGLLSKGALAPNDQSKPRDPIVGRLPSEVRAGLMARLGPSTVGKGSSKQKEPLTLGRRLSSGLLKGIGTGTSDSIPGIIFGKDGKPVSGIAVSTGEAVLNKKATGKLGVPFINWVNRNAEHMASGGVISPGVSGVFAEVLGEQMRIDRSVNIQTMNGKKVGDTNNMTVNVSVGGQMSSSDIRASAQQLAAQVGRQVQRAMARNL